MEKNLGGRPEIGPVRGIRIPEHLWQRLGEYAATHGTTRSAAIRQALEDLVDRDRDPAVPR